MSGTEVSQGSFSFGSDLPPEAAQGRSGDRRTVALEAGRQSKRPDPSDAPQGLARRSQRRRGAMAGDAREPAAGTEHRWLTATEATDYLGFPTRKALYCAVERAQVPAHKLGRRLRFRSEELDALLGRAR